MSARTALTLSESSDSAATAKCGAPMIASEDGIAATVSEFTLGYLVISLYLGFFRHRPPSRRHIFGLPCFSRMVVLGIGASYRPPFLK
jgi:hypothetical protein